MQMNLYVTRQYCSQMLGSMRRTSDAIL